MAGFSTVMRRQPFGGHTSGDNTLVAAVSGKRLLIYGIFMVAGAAANIYFRSSVTNTVLIGNATDKINITPAGAGFVLPHNPVGWAETPTSEGINLNADSTGPFSGVIVYGEESYPL